MQFSADQQRHLLDTARFVIRRNLGDNGVVAPVFEPEAALTQPAGSFVTLHTLEGHRLRGCVGRLDTSAPLLDAVRQAAASAVADPRFAADPVRLDELPELELEITVVLPAVAAAHVLDFEPLQHGIYLKLDARGGCFLPQVARETGWTREQLLSRLCVEKMGLSANSWQSPAAELLRFDTVIVGPQPFGPCGSV